MSSCPSRVEQRVHRWVNRAPSTGSSTYATYTDKSNVDGMGSMVFWKIHASVPVDEPLKGVAFRTCPMSCDQPLPDRKLGYLIFPGNLALSPSSLRDHQPFSHAILTQPRHPQQLPTTHHAPVGPQQQTQWARTASQTVGHPKPRLACLSRASSRASCCIS